MIEFTIKTLDSINHPISVDDEVTVQQLKDKVKDELGILPNLQRLIFCGRVLQDEKKLSEYDVHGKVVHLVQRAPPSPGSRQTTIPNHPITSNDYVHQQIRRLMALTGGNGEEAPMSSPSEGRIRLVRKLVGEIRNELANLKALVREQDAAEASTSNSEPPEFEAMDTDPIPETATEEPEAEPNAEGTSDSSRSQHTYRRTIRAMRSRQSRPRDLAVIFETLESLNQEFYPLRRRYIGLLQNSDFVEEMGEENRVRTQRIVELTCEIMHSFAHAYHAISELHYQVGQRNPRLTSEGFRQHMPAQTHVNVLQARPQATSSNGRPSADGNTDTSTSSAQTDANAAGNVDGQSSRASQELRHNEPTNRSRTFIIESDPVTYQLEIEARVPVALVNAANDNADDTTWHDLEQDSSEEQGNERHSQRTFRDFENQLFGEMGASVEVLMSMGEMTAGVPGEIAVLSPRMGSQSNTYVPVTLAARPASDARDPPQAHVAEVFVAPFPWGNPATTEFLQNILSSVIRQGLVPGVESPSDVNIQNVINVDTTGQIHVQHIDGHFHSIGATRVRSAPDGASDQPSQPRQPTSERPEFQERRPMVSRGQLTSLGNIVYDRFLMCNNVHVRRYVQARRELHYRVIQRRMREAAADIGESDDQASRDSQEAPRDPRPQGPTRTRFYENGVIHLVRTEAQRALELRPLPDPTPPRRYLFPTSVRPQRTAGQEDMGEVIRDGVNNPPSCASDDDDDDDDEEVACCGTCDQPCSSDALDFTRGFVPTFTPASPVPPTPPTIAVDGLPAGSNTVNRFVSSIEAEIDAIIDRHIDNYIDTSSDSTDSVPDTNTDSNEGPLYIEGEFLEVMEADREVAAEGELAVGVEVPHSDAYLAGMPMRKRRRLRAARPTPALNPFISESLADALSDSGVAASATEPVVVAQEMSLQAAFRERIRELAAQRAGSDPDYQCERHAALRTFLQSPPDKT